MTKRENWLRLLHNNNPGWISTPWEAFKAPMHGFVFDPISIEIRKAVPGEFLDQFGCTWKLIEGHSATPYVTEKNKAIKDIKRWREDLILPPLAGHDWSRVVGFVTSVDREEYLVGCIITQGLFERSHCLMGFEDALVNYMIEPDAMYELLAAITEWKIEQLKQVIENLIPDVIVFHDDWGNKDNLFMQPDIWRRSIKPHHIRIVEYIKSRDVLYIHHSDSICSPIIDDMVEMGIDAWQGIIPQEDIPAIQDMLSGRMALISGIDAPVIDTPEANEEVIRSEIQRCIDEYCHRGNFIPCIPNVFPIHQDVNSIYEDELKSYGRDFFKK